MWGVEREAGTLFTKAEIVSWEVASRAPRKLSLAFLYNMAGGRMNYEGHGESLPTSQMCDKEVFGVCACGVWYL